MRQALYPELAAVANRWNEVLGIERRFPPTLKAWLGECHAGGQQRPTPLLLRYGPGDYNCLHRDLYGELVFPMQATILLSQPGRDFEGGEFLLVEQRPRMQSRGEVVPLEQGDAVLFAVNQRPAKGTRGWHRTACATASRACAAASASRWASSSTTRRKTQPAPASGLAERHRP